MLGTNGAFIAMKRAEQVPREREKSKQLRARRRDKKIASRVARCEGMQPGREPTSAYPTLTRA